MSTDQLPDAWDLVTTGEVRVLLGGISAARVRQLTMSGALWCAKLSPTVRIYSRRQVMALQRRREEAKRARAEKRRVLA